MAIKSTVRRFLQGWLPRFPRQFHRYVLSLYSNVPAVGLHSGFHVIRNLSEGQTTGLADSLHYLTRSPLAQRILGASRAPVIFDVGANIGQTCSSYAKAFPQSTVHSFEPFEENISYLRQSCKDLPGIRSHQLALSDSNGTIEVMRDHHPLSQWNSVTPAYQQQLAQRGQFTRESIGLKTGDAFCREESIQRITLLKIDTEGHEMSVLNGFATLFEGRAIDSVLVEVGFGDDTSHGPFHEVNDFMRSHGMKLCGFHDPDYKPDGTMNFANAFYCHEKWLGISRPTADPHAGAGGAIRAE